MPADPAARILPLSGVAAPALDETAFVAAGAVIAGDVRLGELSSVWYNAVLRAEAEAITIGARSNLQDGVACHVDAGYPLSVGAGVSVGHRAVLHGCTIGDDCLIGMSATIMNGAVIGEGSLVAAGAVVLEGTVVPPGSLVAGVPAKVRRELGAEEQAGIRRNADGYLRLAEVHQTPVD